MPGKPRGPLADSKRMCVQILCAINWRVKMLGLTRGEAARLMRMRHSDVGKLLDGKRNWSAGYLLDCYALLGGKWSLYLPQDDAPAAPYAK